MFQCRAILFNLAGRWIFFNLFFFYFRYLLTLTLALTYNSNFVLGLAPNTPKDHSRAFNIYRLALYRLIVQLQPVMVGVKPT